MWAALRAVACALLTATALGACEGGGSTASGALDVDFELLHWGGMPRLDILFVVDDSRSMADKQSLLADAVPGLLRELAEPKVGADGTPLERAHSDIHLGVITTSLGSHGGDGCGPSPDGSVPEHNDRARLLPSVRAGLASFEGLGFLRWNPRETAAGVQDVEELAHDFSDHVRAAGSSGCGYEATLEAWYRFLVDPAPPLDIVVEQNAAVAKGVDQVVLTQRQDFLRPDSAVVIVMLSDENDCSVVDGGVNWIATQTWWKDAPYHLPRATSACALDPDGPCCRSCNTAESGPPPGCVALDQDPECLAGAYDSNEDHPNLRCFQQKRRFGLEFLYPTRRYVEALTQPTICPHWDAEGPIGCDQRVENPLFAPTPSGSRAEPVLLAGIVGVPWQDIADPSSLQAPDTLRFEAPNQLAWDLLIPQCLEHADPSSLPVPLPMCAHWDDSDEPDDPLMRESVWPRSGKNPVTGSALSKPTGAPGANPINGHEWLPPGDDLQYACIFPLAEARDCGSPANPDCDCDDVGAGYSANSPLCQDETGKYTQVQRYAKAYPATRQLEVLHDLGEGAIVASICPKTTLGEPNAAGFGFNPALRAISERFRATDSTPFDLWCLDWSIRLDATGTAACRVFDLRFEKAACTCDESGFAPIDAKRRATVLRASKEHGACDRPGTPACDSLCVCELEQLAGAELSACQNEPVPNAKLTGFCPIVSARGVGNPKLEEWCAGDEGLLRFVGLSGSVTVLVGCSID